MKKLLEIFKGDNGQLSSKRFVGIKPARDCTQCGIGGSG
jgi:hypothetical protein